MPPPTRLALLWHMHQPYYEDLATGEHILPWVRMHAIKDYWGMAALLREFPTVRVTFNLVPSLLVQIQAFADDRARDPHLIIGLKPAEQLEASERAFLVANGFHAPVERMIRPYPRYAELYARRGAPEAFTVDELRDLQVWHKLAWMDPDWLQHDARLRGLVARGHAYTEQDKRVLRLVELELLHAVIPVYRERAEAGQVELSTSPFYHPILPLLCDTDVHLHAHPGSPLPRHLFSRPGDAAEQIQRAMTLHRELFGQAPHGVWPSEGALSDEVLQLLGGLGCTWTASDEELLARSLQQTLTADALYRPYEAQVGAATAVRCLFRDHGLSDLIGFTYQSWDPETAADHFVERVRHAGQRFRDSAPTGSGEAALVTVILDGENPWEHYAGGGRPFLRALYRRLAEAGDIVTVTMAEAAAGPARRIHSMFPGSWIHGDFYIWAGHADDHRAWAQLADARLAFDRAAPAVAAEARERAWEELLIAEGSDWFWWYGDDHSSDHDREFDELFRRHLRNVYAALSLHSPDELHLTNITTAGTAAGPLQLTRLLTPQLDGELTWFAEWRGAVPVPIGAAAGAMHRVSAPLAETFHLAADRSALFFRLGGDQLVRRLLLGDVGLAVLLERPRQARVVIVPGGVAGARWVARECVEVAVPYLDLGVQAGDDLRLTVVLTSSGGAILEQYPAHPLEVQVPTRHVSATHWTV
jgi:alpha-amylase/alpha-mannosidase (GH57 family)